MFQTGFEKIENYNNADFQLQKYIFDFYYYVLESAQYPRHTRPGPVNLGGDSKAI